jgi:hypothetical protein
MTLLPDDEHREGLAQSMSTEGDWPDGPVPGSVSCSRFHRDEEPTGAQLSIDAGPMGSVKAFRFSVREIRGPAPPDES